MKNLYVPSLKCNKRKFSSFFLDFSRYSGDTSTHSTHIHTLTPSLQQRRAIRFFLRPVLSITKKLSIYLFFLVAIPLCPLRLSPSDLLQIDFCTLSVLYIRCSRKKESQEDHFSLFFVHLWFFFSTRFNSWILLWFVRCLAYASFHYGRNKSPQHSVHSKNIFWLSILWNDFQLRRTVCTVSAPKRVQTTKHNHNNTTPRDMSKRNENSFFQKTNSMVM